MFGRKSRNDVPLFLSASLLVVVLLLAACGESSLGGGGEDLPDLSEETSPEVTQEPFLTDEPSTESTEGPAVSGETTHTGSIDSLDLEANRITLMQDTGETMEVNVDEFLTLVTIDGSAGSLQDLQPGDSTEVVIDEATKTAASITVPSNSLRP